MAQNVLVVGPRLGLKNALKKAQIPFSIWEPKISLDDLNRLTEPEMIRYMPSKRQFPTITHVIAGTENGVIPASIIRQILQARRNEHNTIVKCRDKLLMKKFLESHKVPMTDFIDLNDEISDSTVCDRLKFPVVVKSRVAGGGRDMQIVKSLPEFSKARANGRNLIAETYVEGDEFSIESFVQSSQIQFSNVTQYYEKKHVNIVPGEVPHASKKLALVLNQKIVSSLGLIWGMTHAEFYQSKNGLLFGEIAVRPPGGYIMPIIEQAYGFDPWDKFVKIEMGIPAEFPKENKFFSASIILHPGSGVVRSIEGQGDIQKILSVVDFKIKAEIGKTIKPRTGVGQDAGYVILCAGSAEKIILDIEEVRSKLRIRTK